MQYAPSTKFYVADKLAGKPWVTRLPFPVQVVEQVQVYDFISRNLFVTRYSYHHGYFDGVEREFRGFGRVEQFDTEEFATLSNSTDFPQAENVDSASNIPPVFTKTWFHTGVFFGENRISNYLQHEYYTEGDASDGISGLTSAQSKAMLLADTVLPTSVLLPDDSAIIYDLSGEEMREACRALRGSILRQEIFAEDATDASDRPYSVSERNYTIEVFQPQGPNPYAVFYAHAREVVEFHYERTLYTIAGPPAQTVADPRVTHILTLAVDAFGNVKQSVSIAYGRRHPDTDLSLADQATQAAILSTYKESSFTNAVTLDDSYRARAAARSSTYELIQLNPPAPVMGITTLFRFDDIQKQVQQAGDGLHDIEYENLHPVALNVGETYRRLFERKRTLYRPDDMGAAAANPRALLGLDVLQSLALPGQNYQLAFTPGLIMQVYVRSATALLPAPATVLGSTASDGGGYIDLDGDLHWWIPSERIFYLPGAPASPAENNQARQHFFLPRRFESPFGSTSTVDYEVPHDLLPLTTNDATGNITTAVNDYRVIAPSLLTDANNNRAAVSFDALGLVVGNAVMGKVTESLGDLLTGFSPDLTQAEIDAFYSAADPHTLAAPLLGNATSRIVYDVHRFQNSRAAAPADPTKWQPSFAATLARETHFFDLAPGAQSKIQISIGFSDGLGREIQNKV